MLSPPLMFVLFHPLLDLWVGREQIRDFGDDEPLGQSTLEVESFADIGRDEHEVITLGFKELIESLLASEAVGIVRDDSITQAFGMKPLHQRFAYCVCMWEDYATLVRPLSHDSSDGFDLTRD